MIWTQVLNIDYSWVCYRDIIDRWIHTLKDGGLLSSMSWLLRVIFGKLEMVDCSKTSLKLPFQFSKLGDIRLIL